MIQYFKRLSDAEIELMLKAPIMVSILIAGADGTIDDTEIKGAIDFAKKQTHSKSLLEEYFREVSQDLEDKFKIMVQGYPYKQMQRAPIIVEELTSLNGILPRIDKEFAREFYLILKSIAHKIASSSGGLLGMNKVGDEEAKYLELYMINDPASSEKTQ